MRRTIVLLSILMLLGGFTTAKTPTPAGEHSEHLIAMQQRMSLKALEREVGPVTAYFSQQYPTPCFIDGNLTPPAQSGYLKVARQFMSSHYGLFQIKNPHNEFYTWTQQTDELGYTHLKLQQCFNRFDVYGKQLIFHFDERGAMYCISGQYMPTPDVSVTPLYTKDELVDIAKNYFEKISRGGVAWTKARLVILPHDRSARLACLVTVQGELVYESWDIFVDADNGEILKKLTNIYTDGPVTGSGTGVNGGNRSLNLYQQGSYYYCIDATKAMWGGSLYNGVIAIKDMEHDSLVYYSDTSQSIVRSSNTTISDPTAVDASYHFSGIYDLYHDMAGINRNSFDDAGHNINVYIHLENNYNNAFWSSELKRFFFGDGDGTRFKPITAAGDVCCHEFQHGVTSYTANLEYQSQSGALNEAYSDIAGSVFDSLDWKIGEDCAGASLTNGALRFMDNPHLADPPLPADMSEYQNLPPDMDHGGVHVNCSIHARAFSIMVDNYLGRARGWKIWYRALKEYLTPNSDFVDGAVNVRRAAEDLYGTEPDWSNIENAICNAFDDVGLDAGCGGGTPSNPDTGQYLYLFNENAPDVYGFYMPDPTTYDQYAAAVRFTPPSYPGLKVVGIHFGIAYCWTLSDMFMYLGTTMTYEGEIYPDAAFALDTIPNDDLWDAPMESSYVVSAIFDEPVSGDFFAVATCPESDPYWDDWVLTAVDDASGGTTDGNRNVTTGVAPDKTWILMEDMYGDDYNFIMAASINAPGLDAPELLFPNTPITFALRTPKPNPFNAQVTLEYSTPYPDVKLAIYDITGRSVRTLFDGGSQIGTNYITWDGKDDAGNKLPSGTYYAKLSRGIWKQTQKLTLVK